VNYRWIHSRGRITTDETSTEEGTINFSTIKEEEVDLVVGDLVEVDLEGEEEVVVDLEAIKVVEVRFSQ